MNDHLQNFPIDIVVFAIVAIGLAWRLYVVLGRKGAASSLPDPGAMQAAKVVPQRAQTPPKPVQPQSPTRQIPRPGTRVGDILTALAREDRHFQPSSFLDEVERGFGMVVLAYAAGDRATLQRFLTPVAYTSFEQAIVAREQAGETQRTEIRAVLSLAIEDAGENADISGAAWIEVRIISHQISLTLGSDGQPVSGTDALTEFSDLWRFERALGSGETLWRLAAARAA